MQIVQLEVSADETLNSDKKERKRESGACATRCDS